MSNLSDILRAHEEQISLALIENLEREDCSRLMQTRAGGGRAMLEAVGGCLATGSGERTPVSLESTRNWAKTLYDGTAALGMPRSEVMAGLDCLEQAVRFHVVKATDQKAAMLGALTELGHAVGRLRQFYVDVLLAEQPHHSPRIGRDAFVALAHSVDAFICMADLHGKPFYLNPAGCRLLGLDEDEPALSATLHDYYTDESWEELRDEAVPAVKETGRWEGQSRIRNVKTGKLVYVLTTMLLVRGSHSQRPSFLAIIHQDASDQRKKVEKARAHYAAELERSNRELAQFAYVASHDLQEPLRKIRTFGDRLEKKSGQLLDETGRDCLTRMQNAAVRMQGLIEGLLTLSHVTTRAGNFEQIDLGKVAREVVSDLEVQIEQVGGRVEVGKLPVIQADALQMRQLLQNLIGNALKFHRPGAPPVVEIHGRLSEDRCRVFVEDNGVGFEEKHLDRVFGIFQCLHSRDVYEGTGIGLPICRKIVQRHGGTITAQSVPGGGSTFDVMLPVSQPKGSKE